MKSEKDCKKSKDYKKLYLLEKAKNERLQTKNKKLRKEIKRDNDQFEEAAKAIVYLSDENYALGNELAIHVQEENQLFGVIPN